MGVHQPADEVVARVESALDDARAFVADVDPANAVAEGNEDDNAYPASGTPQTMDVREVPALAGSIKPCLPLPTRESPLSLRPALRPNPGRTCSSPPIRPRPIHPRNTGRYSVPTRP